MKKSLSFLLGALVPCVLLVGACGDDVIDAAADDDVDQDATPRQDATTLPPRDASQDAAADVRTDARDTGTPDVDVDAADVEVPPDPAIKTFVEALATAACAKYEGCCAGDPGVPVPGPTVKTCAEAATTDRAFFNGLLDAYYYNPQVATGNRVVLDAAKAQECLADVDALGCLDEGVAATVWKELLQDCGTALSGVGLEGDQCYSDIECTRSFACIGAVSGGAAGVCTALKAEGQPYQNSAQFYGDSCSYRGFAFDTGRRNQKTEADGGAELCLDQQDDGQQCAPFTPEGEYFGSDYDCKSYACSLSDDFARNECRDTKTDFLYCAQYVIP